LVSLGSGAINFRSFRTKEASETSDITIGNNKSNSKACVLIVIELQHPQTHTFDGKIGRNVRAEKQYRKRNQRKPCQIEIRGWRCSGKMDGKIKNKN